jgi:hypothetical protein
MFKQHLFGVLLFATVLVEIPFVFSQNNTQIVTWQKQHPEIDFIREANFQQLSKAEKSLLLENGCIIFESHITEEIINSYAASHGLKGIVAEKSSAEDLIVQTWLKTNPSVKIVTRSEFDRESQNVQEELMKCGTCLILSGDELTAEDIENYQH